MQRSTQILFLIVVGILVSLGALVSKQTMRTPQEVLEEVRAALRQETFEEQTLLRRLSASLRGTEPGAAGNPALEEVCAELRLTRGKLLLRIGATDEAREDFLEVMERYRPGDRSVRRLLIEAENAEGQTESALLHLEQLLRDEPKYGPAWVERGRLHQQLAAQILASCAAKLNFALVEEDAVQALEVVKKLAARDAQDSRRTTTILELRQLFPPTSEEIFQQVLGLCEEASAQLSASRTAYVHSFSLGLDSVALRRYLQILRDAGQDEEVLLLGGLVALPGEQQSDLQTAELLMRLLLDRDDATHAAQLASKWSAHPEPLSMGFLQLCCEALYKGRDWSGLVRTAQRMTTIGNSEDEPAYKFYAGLGQANLARMNAPKAIPDLTRFVRSEAPEPFVGARALAWGVLASLYKNEGNLVAEREALQAALNLDPDSSHLWIRRSEIQKESKNGSYALPLDSWLNAMVLQPQNTERLMPEFIELGESRLRADERDLDLLYAELRRSGQAYPRRDHGPYVMLKIAGLHGEKKNYSAQVATATKLLTAHPNFIPALDELINARRSLGDRELFINLVLERVSKAGLDTHSTELLGEIDIDEFSKPQVLQVMGLDPAGTGRRVATYWYHNNGEKALAIETLATSAPKQRTDSERLLGARILIDNGDYQIALRWLDQISMESALASTKLKLAVACSLRMGDPQETARRTQQLLKHVALGPQDLMLMADGFMRELELVAASALLDRVDRQRLGELSAFQLREICVALLGRDKALAQERIERAAAFLSREQYLIARMLLDVQNGNWKAVESGALLLSKTEFAQSGLRPIWIALCSGLEAELLTGPLAQENSADTAFTVARCTAQALSEEPLDALLAFGKGAGQEMRSFLLGGPDLPVAQDPRAVAVWMLAMEAPEFRDLSIGRLRSLDPNERGTFWPLQIAAELNRAEKRETDASRLLEELLLLFPDAERSWEELELSSVARFGSALHPQVNQVRNRRLTSLALNIPGGPAQLLLDARRLRKEGDINGATRAILRAQQLATGWFEAEYAVAQLTAQLGQWQEALDAWKLLIASSRLHERPRAFVAYLGTVDAILTQDPPPIPLDELKQDLARLNKTIPGNPGCILALARLDLVIDKKNPALGLERARARMRELRANNSERSLEDMQRGATKDWAHFYLETDPGSAEAFIQSELERQPGNLELWLLLGRVHRELGEFPESSRVLSTLSIIAPSADVQVELARTTVARGAPPRVLRRVVTELYKRSKGPTLEGRLLTAAAQLAEFLPTAWEEALVDLELLWEERHQLEEPSDRRELAKLYGRALILRGQPEDDSRAANVLQTGNADAQNTYQRELFSSLIGIASSRVRSDESQL